MYKVLVIAVFFISLSVAGEKKTCSGCDTLSQMNVTKVSYFSVGGSYYDLDNLNSSLNGGGYTRLENAVVQVAIGKDYRFNRVISDYSFTGHWWRRAENSEKRTRMFGLDFQSTFGFDFLETPKMALYPYAGFGVGGLFLQLGQNEIPFDDIVTGVVAEDQLLSQMTFDIHTGLGFDVRIKESDPSPLFGIKAGYRFDVSDGNRWYRSYSTTSQAPSLKASGPFVKVIFGFAKDKKF